MCSRIQQTQFTSADVDLVMCENRLGRIPGDKQINYSDHLGVYADFVVSKQHEKVPISRCLETANTSNCADSGAQPVEVIQIRSFCFENCVFGLLLAYFGTSLGGIATTVGRGHEPACIAKGITVDFDYIINHTYFSPMIGGLLTGGKTLVTGYFNFFFCRYFIGLTYAFFSLSAF